MAARRELRSRAATTAFLLMIATGGACGKPSVTNGPGGSAPGRGGGSGPAGGGGGSGGTGTGGPGLAIPDAGADLGPGSPGGPPGIGEQCAESSKQAEQVPVDLMLVVDSSGSMVDASGTSTKWELATEALRAFVKDPRSNGLGVGLGFFPKLPPEKPCTSNANCPVAGALVESCRQKHLCGKAGAAIRIVASECNPAGDGCDDATDSCLPVGTCSMGGGDCLGVGQPCPGGPAGNMCTARSRVCRQVPDGGWCMQNYAQATVAIAVLPANESALTGALTTHRPEGGTPLGPALKGAITQMVAHRTANPGRKVAIILVSDGLPDGFCSRNFADMIIEDVATARTGPAAIPTYVIGVFAADDIPRARPVMERLATAGGTGMPFLLMTANDLGQRFQETLNQIRGTALACEFMIPTGTGAIDYGKVNVHWQGAAANEDLLYVGSADRCDPSRGGWYFDVDPATGRTPTRVLVCPASCNKFKADPAAKVEVRFGCKTRTID
jgi:hypothetical protein